LSVEGTILSEETDIDITIGEPIFVREYLEAPRYREVMACGLNDMNALEDDPGSLFNDAAHRLMQRYMRDIYDLTTVNYDHLFAAMLRHQPPGPFTERAFRNRVFLCAHELARRGTYRLHSLLERTYRDMVYEEPSEKFNDFMGLSVKEGVLTRDGDTFTKNPPPEMRDVDFHEARWEELTEVIANEAEPLTTMQDTVRRVARLPRLLLSKRIRDTFLDEDLQIFETDYAKYYDPELSKGPEVGRPFLLKPLRPRGGVVLSHGYMAAPLEIRKLAEFLFAQGYAVYGVRLRGHGTSPYDLGETPWEEWYESFNRGYAVIKTLTDRIILGGFSTGGCMALIAAARKGRKVQAAFSICAPLQIRKYGFRLIPSIVTLNTLLKRIGQNRTEWEYVENEPENKHINYNRNPLTGVRELVEAIDEMERVLPEVDIPTVVIQASKDPTVHPASAQVIFDKLSSKHKELTVFERDRHGIVNHEGREDVFARLDQFLTRAPAHTITEDLVAEREHDQAEAASPAAAEGA